MIIVTTGKGGFFVFEKTKNVLAQRTLDCSIVGNYNDGVGDRDVILYLLCRQYCD